MSAAEERKVADVLADLSPAQRRLLEQRLMQKRAAAGPRNPIGKRAVHSPVPLSYSQELLWLLHQIEPDGIAYNAPAAVRLQGALDLEALQRALTELVARHEILRTRYDLVDGHPMQLIDNEPSFEFQIVDLAGTPPEAREDELRAVLKRETQRPFDLRTGPMLRATIVRLAPEEHVFLIVEHHIATDGSSRGVWLAELTTLYESFVRGAPSPLPDVGLQYGDFAVWHRQWLDSGVLDRQLGYWKETLRGLPARLELPTDHPRPAVRTYRGNNDRIMLPVSLREALRDAARADGGTLFMSLLATFAALLHRYSSQDDIVIGTPFSGRNRSEFESVLGYFVNPTALRMDLTGDPTFRTLLSRARETTLAAFANGDVPYEMVVRAVSPQRDPSQTPVFQVLMVLHNPDWRSRRPRFEPEGVTATELSPEKGWAKFDLLLGMSEREEGLNATWEYSTELFEGATVARMMQHFRTLAQSAVASPDRPISQLSMLSEEERHQVVFGWNRPADTPLPEPHLVKDLFERQAATTPEATAVVFEGESLTYAELNRRANRVAHGLAALGAGPGSLVGVLLEKSLDLVVSVIGVIKSGAAYVPLDPLYPRDRLEFMLADSRPTVLVTNERALADVPVPEGTTVVSFDEATAANDPDHDLPTRATDRDLAYVIYTSGSTGRPKGAMITNRSLANAHLAYEAAYGLDKTTAHLQMASFSFDVFTGDVVRTLLSGRKLVLCPLTTVMDPPRLFELMVREKVDCAEFVPAVATLLFEHVESIGKSLDFMRVIVVSSEAWRCETYASFKRLCGPQTRLINSYGLTEATIDSTYFESTDDAELVPERFVPIGQPLLNTQVYVLDRNLQPTPIGVPGELCVGGEGVAEGYLNRPDLTAERFVPDPFRGDPEARLYRTGDLARWLPDGTIEFLGRTDRQIKIRGFRIEPGEVEAALERHPAVRAAAVVAREDAPGDAWLAAYVEPAAGDPPTATALRAFLSDELPAFMVPASFTVVDALPISPNGKIDRDALPTPERISVDESALVLPRNESEQRIASIWKSVLELDGPIGVTDDFFALGGHSLLAVRVFAEIERIFGVKLPLALLFQGATVEHLAAQVNEKEGRPDEWSLLVPLRATGTRKPLFLMHGIDGEILFYRELVNRLPADQPVYALQPRGADGRADPDTRVEVMAARYVDAILDFEPDGPYLLAGYCFSGVLAYEVARQLRERGLEPALIAVIDGAPAGHNVTFTRVELERQKFAEFRRRDLRGKLVWMRTRGRGLRKKIEKRVYWFTHDLLVRMGLPLPQSLMDVNEAIVRARSHYVTPESESRLTLFRAASELHESFDRIAIWKRLAKGGVELHPIEGDGARHDNLLDEPHVQTLAAALDECIVRALDGESAYTAEEVA